MNKILLILLLLLTNFASEAQETISQPSMADTFRADGKIYVVVAVMGIIFTAIVVLLIVLERRLKKLENELNNKK